MSQAANNIFDIKSASLDLLAMILKTDKLDTLASALEQRFGAAGAHAHAEAFVLDLEALTNPTQLDLARLLPLLFSHGIRVLALRHSSSAIEPLALQHGLVHISDSTRPQERLAVAQPASEPTPVKPSAEPVKPAVELPMAATMIVDRPVRAGQQIYAKGASLVVLAMVSAGAEIIADGDIHVYAPLRGRALAGARGNTAARIFARSMEAELVSIAGVYRTLEQALPDSIMHKPTQVFLESERLVMTVLGE